MSKEAPLILYDPKIQKTLRKMPNAVNNQPRSVDENIAVDGIIPPHRQLIVPRGRAHHPAHMMFKEDDADLDAVGATVEIVLPTLPPGVKFTITSTMIQLLNLESMFRGAAEATNWLNEMPEDFIRTWTELKKAFLEGFYPESKEPQMEDEISTHKQLLGEAMHDTWIIHEKTILREHVVAGRAEQSKREEERDWDIAHMRTQIDILTKYLVSKSEKVNDVGQHNRVTILEMQVGIRLGNDNMIGQQIESRETGRIEMGNRDQASGISSGSKLEDMMAKVLQKV
ncbi:hypothetical protein KY285_026152 [Solanum tuberosum]|nr:hypothetical protein KY285_026152 [Solanum tuberosum]